MKSNNKVKVVMYTNEDIYKLKSDLEKYDGKCNIYFTLNPINPENLEKFLKAKEKSGINGGCGAGEKNQILAFRDCN